MKNPRIRHIYNLEFGKPRLWERIVLSFLPAIKAENETVAITYKYFWDRLYICTRQFKGEYAPYAVSTRALMHDIAKQPWRN